MLARLVVALPASQSAVEHRVVLELSSAGDTGSRGRMGDEGVRPEAAGWVPRLGGGHQEVDRILDELEQIYASQPNEWLVADPIASMVMREEGYEDEDELEDALGGSWEAFLGGMPHIEVRRNARDDLEFKVLKPDPDAPPRRLTLRVDSRDDLWRVLFKAPEATILIPHLEFEIGADHKRRVDTLYNYIAAAEWNLSSHIRGRKDLAAEYVVAISETVEQLLGLLDVEQPFDLVLNDPAGASIFKPDHGVASTPLQLEPAARPPAAVMADMTEEEEAEALAAELAALTAEEGGS